MAEPNDGAAAPATSEASLAEEARLEPILGLALARHPDLDESRMRESALAAGARATGRLPAPEIKAEQWGTPLRHPYRLGHADALMIGLRQGFPAWGTRGAAAAAAAEDAAAAREETRRRRIDLGADVRRAFAEYQRTDHELRLHREHAVLTARLLELSRASYEVGRGSQPDVLRLQLELQRLHADVARIAQEKRSSQALLNALMARAADAPLGPTPEPAPPPARPAVAALLRDLDRRPDLAARVRQVGKGEALLDGAEKAASRPAFMVGLDYMYMPEGHDPHGYGAMVSMSLPWLQGGRADAVAGAEGALRADRRALDGARLDARFQVEDAAAKYDGAHGTLAAIDRDLLPLARRAFESAEAAFAAGYGDASGLLDALRSYLQVRVERVRAIARLHAAAAALDRAAGKEASP